MHNHFVKGKSRTGIVSPLEVVLNVYYIIVLNVYYNMVDSSTKNIHPILDNPCKENWKILKRTI